MPTTTPTKTTPGKAASEMGPLQEFFCEPCNFAVRTRRPNEIVQFGGAHVKTVHGMVMSEKDLMAKARRI